MNMILRAFVLCKLLAWFAMPSLSAPTTRPSMGPAENPCNTREPDQWNAYGNWNTPVCEIRQKANGVKLMADVTKDVIVDAIRIRAADLEYIRNVSFIENQLAAISSIATAENRMTEPPSSQELFVTFYSLLLTQLQYVEGIIDNNTVIKSISDSRVHNVVNKTFTVISKIQGLSCEIRTGIGSRAARSTTANQLHADFNPALYRGLGEEGCRAYIVMADTVKLINAILYRTNYAACGSE